MWIFVVYVNMNNKNKNVIKKKLIIEGLFALFIAISPLIFYAYKYIPVQSDNNWTILGITFTNNGYTDVGIAFYFYLSKLMPLALLVVWFITCKQWWYHTILIPIAMYAFQLYSVFSEDADKIDESEVLYLLGVCMIVIPAVYFIRLKLVDKHVHGIDLEAMDAELKAYQEKERLRNEGKDAELTHGAATAHAEEKTDLSNKHKQDHFFLDFQGKVSKWLDLKF